MNLSNVIKDCGNPILTPLVVLGDGESRAEYLPVFEKNEKTASLRAEVKGLYRDTLDFRFDGQKTVCRRVFENISGKELAVKELAVEISDITFGENPRDDYFYHNENPRIYEAMTFPIDFDRTSVGVKESEFDIQAGNRWADPGVICERIGASPYQPFPAVLVSNYNTKNGIVHGSLSQNVFFHNYLISHDTLQKVKIIAFSSFKATAYVNVEPDKTLIDEWYLGATQNADDIEKIFEEYTDELRKRLTSNRAKNDVNRTSVIWGSWNDGVFRSVNEQLVLDEAKYISENFPTVKWIQLDDGYSRYSRDNDVASGIATPYDGEEGVDERGFPNGLRYLTDSIKEYGLRPAIWIGGLCPKGTKIYRDIPEWFIDYSYRITNQSPLDVSREAVRDYMEKAVGTLTAKQGFEGVKLDFWSYAFEDSHDLLGEKNASGYEYRRWFFETIRKNLPEDGYLQTGCDIGEGNPFLGEFVNNYRYGIDIGAGNWDYVKTNYLWGVSCFATHTGDLAVPNSDSVGLFPGLKENEAMFCINYCLVTHSMVEVAGLLSKSGEKERIAILKKALCNPNNGQDVYFADYDYRSNKYCVPEIMYFTTPHFSTISENELLPLRTVGVFNIWEENKSYVITPEKLGLQKAKYRLVDVWSGESFELDGEFSVEIAPHSSRLFAVCSVECLVYDANFRINSVCGDDGRLFIQTDYAVKDAQISFAKAPSTLLFNGDKVKFSAKSDGTVTFDIPEKGTLSAEF